DMPLKPSFRGRVNAGLQRAGGFIELLAQWLTKLAWSLVLWNSPVSPRLKAAVDNFLREDPQPVRTVLIVVSWVARHGTSIVALADLLSRAVVEARFVLNAHERARKAYARELILDFLDQEIGLPDRNGLGFRLLTVLIDEGIDILIMLFEKHNFADFHAAQGGQPEDIQNEASKAIDPVPG